MLYDADMFDPNDTMGAGVPIYLVGQGSTVSRFSTNDADASESVLPKLLCADSPSSLDAAEEEATKQEQDGVSCAIALPPGAPLWAQALIGLRMSEEDAATMDMSGL